MNELSGSRYSFVFAAAALYDSAGSALAKSGSDARMVVISEFGDSVPDGCQYVLSTPIYTIPVANILNGVYDDSTRGLSDKTVAGFTAPEARVLIVDDISMNLIVARGLMQPYNMKVDLRPSGAEAITAIKNNSYDIVFMDHMMPEMDGIETVARIRELEDSGIIGGGVEGVGSGGGFEGGGGRLPIVALTANAVSGTKEMFLENGFDDFLSKPIDTTKLDSMLEKWIPNEKKVMGKHDGDETQGVSLEGIAIKGIDTERGIFMTGGSLKNYLHTLAVFHSNGLEKIKEIEGCLSDGNISLFTTYVHALRSASASIGAFSLSNAADNLEMAGIRDDRELIYTHAPRFLSILKVLLQNINEALLERGGSLHYEAADIEALRSGLIKLKEAFAEFDIAVINEAAADLQSFTGVPGTGESIKQILEYKLAGAYDEAESLIDEVLGGL